ncbi:MAG TPA: hypothetical protein VK986_18715 [Tepidisphaeraceae bacterium]|nr:hypothetical protein [Tepidisphaeraceae bacterium]
MPRRSVPLLAVLCLFASPAFAGDSFTDYDRRIARTLYNSLKPNSAADKGAADPAKLDQPPKKQDNKSQASINIPGEKDSSLMSGYYRVGINTGLGDAAGWTKFGVDPASGAEILYKQVDNTTAEKHTNYGCRRQIGNVTLTVALRRPFNEDPKTAAADMLRRYAVLYANAKENGLFAGVVLRVTGGDPKPEPGDAAAELLLPVNGAAKPTRVDYAAMVLDSDQKPVPNVKRLRIKLTGPLAKFAVIEGGRAKEAAGGSYEIPEPGPSEAFTLVLNSSAPGFADALFAHAASAAAGVPVSVKVIAEFK